jgi:fermentation-respiration switch protein FrsA (DUF1100 family)
MWLNSIQVSKGVASVAAGHEAITGQINLEHRKPTDEERLFVNLYLDDELRPEINLSSAIPLTEDKRLSTIILFHGYHSHHLQDFAGIYDYYHSIGLNLLLVRQRSHGESGGRYVTFGVKERLDAKCWAEYAAERFPDAPIFLSGISMGAATVLMAASLPLPAAVVGVLADCPYSSPKEIIMKVVGEMGLPPKLIYPLIRLGALLYGGFDPNGSEAVRSVRMKTPPLLIVHGTADGFVPSEMSSKIDAAAAGEHTLVLVDGADHGKSFTVAPELYVKTVNGFFDACLKNREGRNG